MPIVAAGSLAPQGCAHAPADAQLEAFEANLAAHASATEALRQWCARQGIAADPVIVARPVAGADAAPPEWLRAALGVSEGEPLGYRHVELVCGDIVLSRAHNWYLPARLTTAMNRQLAETDRPFGRVAQGLGFTREPIASARRGQPGCPSGAISTHRALLRLPDGRGLAMVVECYSEANLGTR